MRVIIDTNIWVAGLISGAGAPAKIVDAVLSGMLVPVMSGDTLAELETVLTRPALQPYFKHAGRSPAQLLSELKQVAEFAKPRRIPHLQIRDAKDRPFLELAASRPTPDFLITGDKDFEKGRYAGVSVVSAAIFARTILHGSRP